jgi:hypothetical protein
MVKAPRPLNCILCDLPGDLKVLHCPPRGAANPSFGITVLNHGEAREKVQFPELFVRMLMSLHMLFQEHTLNG